MEETTPTLDPCKGDPIAKALGTQPTETDGVRNEDGGINRTTTKVGKLDWRQTTDDKTTADERRMREPRHP